MSSVDDLRQGERVSPDEYAAARLIALRKLAAAPRSRVELERALLAKGVSADAAAAVLERFEESKLVDDVEYANLWVASRHTHRGLSRSALRRELRQRGVSDDIIDGAVAEIDNEQELRAAADLVRRRARSMFADPPERRTRRLVAMLARRGYTGATALRAVQEGLLAAGIDPTSTGDDFDHDLLSIDNSM